MFISPIARDLADGLPALDLDARLRADRMKSAVCAGLRGRSRWPAPGSSVSNPTTPSCEVLEIVLNQDSRLGLDPVAGQGGWLGSRQACLQNGNPIGTRGPGKSATHAPSRQSCLVPPGAALAHEVVGNVAGFQPAAIRLWGSTASTALRSGRIRACFVSANPARYGRC
jgi:hypothetical protein